MQPRELNAKRTDDSYQSADLSQAMYCTVSAKRLQGWKQTALAKKSELAGSLKTSPGTLDSL